MTSSRALACVSLSGILTFTLAVRAQTVKPETVPPQPGQPQKAPIVAGPRAVAKVYAEFCASCHGPTLDGGQAPTLLDDTWSFGSDDASLAQTIRDGRPPAPMPSFKAALSEQEIRALVIFIREEHAKARVTRATAKPPAPIDGMEVKSELETFKLEVVAEGLDTPWGIAWMPDGSMLVTERIGRVRHIGKDGAVSAPIEGVPPVWVKQDGGLMDIAIHPKFGTDGNNWIYLAFSEPGKIAESSTTRIIRARLEKAPGASGASGPSSAFRLVDHQTLFQAPPELYWIDNTHFGARFIFDKDGHLFYSIGDRGHDKDAQDLGSPYGKLHRIHDDGRVPDDNPFVKTPGAIPTIWSYGHRNQQGLAFHPVTGVFYASEHGPRGGDELNVIVPGKNYGWPEITYGMNYDGTPITDRTEQAGMEQPLVQWTPSIAVCALEFYTGDRLPRWKHELFVTALAFRELRRLTLKDGQVVSQEVLFKNIGRVRDVATGPDGFLYVALNEPGRIVRLVPASTSRTP
jgi:glucose/arabinose dehydrogenase